MAGRRGDHRGGIVGLWELHEEHPSALEHELIRLGLRWRNVGTPELSWRDVMIIVAEAPVESALTRARYEREHLRLEHLLEALHYQLAVANVQRGNQSKAKKEDFPPIPDWALDSNTIGKKPLPMDEMAAWLGGPFADFFSS